MGDHPIRADEVAALWLDCGKRSGLPGSEVGQHLPPDVDVALAEAVPVGDDSIAVQGDLGGLLDDLQVTESSIRNLGYGPGIALVLPICFELVQRLAGV